jgi:UDP-N-acetylglucosamine 4,6-dehydratase
MSLIYDLDVENVGKVVNNKNILITGGTGSFGHQMVETLLKFNPNKIVVFSRDEFKQLKMQELYSNKNMRYFIGDVRDYDRLTLAFKNIDIIFHAAALKQVPALEYNPMEAVKTNIIGTDNVIRASIFNKVNKVIAISTDKCVEPVNLYGATKLCLEKMIIAGNNIGATNFSVLRYGNVFGSRGSVVEIFNKQKQNKVLTITDKNMTRFTITIQDAINFVLNCLPKMIGGEIFIPKLPSYNIEQLAKIISPESKIEIIGRRPGEKLHELMIGKYEQFIDCGKFYIIIPSISFRDQNLTKNYNTSHIFNLEYSSENNVLISDIELKNIYQNYNLSHKD